ncbi:MAG: hypothetical protein Q8N63_04145 [Nanoarchaeota archaeon]|nr:hypothetical protein [Nanoarchaeota archaeon]
MSEWIVEIVEPALTLIANWISELITDIHNKFKKKKKKFRK